MKIKQVRLKNKNKIIHIKWFDPFIKKYGSKNNHGLELSYLTRPVSLQISKIKKRVSE